MAIFEKFKVRATPTIIVTDATGSEVDWILGYDPPPDNFLAKLKNILAGVDTYRALSQEYAQDPNNLEVVFKLARKYGDRYDEANQAKSLELFRKVVALDPEGKAGTYYSESRKISVPYTQYAEYRVGLQAVESDKPDPAPLRAFIVKYPDSLLMKDVYRSLAQYYSRSAPPDEGAKFFAEYAARFPEDPEVLDEWLGFIVQTKKDLDKGVEIADRIEKLTSSHSVPSYQKDIASLYLARDDKAKADEVYGHSYIEGEAHDLAFSLVEYAGFWINQGTNKESAAAMADLALKIYPTSAYIIQSSARVYAQLDKLDKALEIYGPAYAQENWDKPAPLTSYARFWASQGKNLENALAAVKRSLDLNPGGYVSWDALANVNLKLKYYDEAIKASEKALELAPESWKQYMQRRLDQIKAAVAKETQGEKKTVKK
jgi:tetratricopeptide (TPR) repeat protein